MLNMTSGSYGCFKGSSISQSRIVVFFQAFVSTPKLRKVAITFCNLALLSVVVFTATVVFGSHRRRPSLQMSQQRSCKILGSSSKGVFKRGASNRKWGLFPVKMLIPNMILSVFTLVEAIFLNIWAKPLLTIPRLPNMKQVCIIDYWTFSHHHRTRLVLLRLGH